MSVMKMMNNIVPIQTKLEDFDIGNDEMIAINHGFNEMAWMLIAPNKN